jgi:hypothetical protein
LRPPGKIDNQYRIKPPCHAFWGMALPIMKTELI